jgi:hypothetical protein
MQGAGQNNFTYEKMQAVNFFFYQPSQQGKIIPKVKKGQGLLERPHQKLFLSNP